MKTATKILSCSSVSSQASLLLCYFSSTGWGHPRNARSQLNAYRKCTSKKISLLNDSGKIIKLESHIADNTRERADGYQHICEEVINKTTILFVYSQPVGGRFHMQNVKAPLDIGFFDGAGKLIRTMVMDTYDDGNKRTLSSGSTISICP